MTRPAVRRTAWPAVAASVAIGATASAWGVATPPVARPSDGVPVVNLEHEAVRYHPSGDSVPGTGGQIPTAVTNGSAGDLWHVVLALSLVIGIILALRALARRLSLVPAVGRGGRGLRVLSRTVLSPRQQILLIQVGKRVVVVGDGGTAGMRPLCEITDPDEVASLVGDARAAEATVAPNRSFGQLFRRAAEPFDGGTADEAKSALSPAPAQMPEDVVGLLNQVRGLRQQFDR